MFIMENPIKMDDLGVPLFLKTPTYSKGTAPVGLTPGGPVDTQRAVHSQHSWKLLYQNTQKTSVSTMFFAKQFVVIALYL